MFSFIKWFSSTMQNLKRNKGLWFTLLTVISLIGIFASLYFVNFLVNDVAQKTYVNQKSHYVAALKNKILEQNNYVESVGTVLAKDEGIGKLLFADDANASKKILQKLSLIQEKLNAQYQKKPISLALTERKKQHKEVGVVVTKHGAYFQALIPMADKNGTIVHVDMQKCIASLVEDYKREGKEFAFFVSENSINKIDRDYKKSHYEIYHNHYFIQPKKYDSNFLSALKNLKMEEKLEENGYIKGAHYFIVYQKVYDFNGDLAGFAVVAEEIKNDNSFVNLVKNLVNSVTMVALGLIISMILFLF